MTATATVTRGLRRRAKALGVHIGVIGDETTKPRVMFWSLDPVKLLVTWHPRTGILSTDPRASSHNPGTYYETTGRSKDIERVLAFALRQKERS